MRWPAPTIRLRLALLYGAVFLVTGGVLLTIGYLLVRNGLREHHQLGTILHRMGLPAASSDTFLRQALGSPQELKVAHAIQRQLTADALHQLLLEYLGALLAMTFLSIVAGYWLAGRALRPLRAIIATAQRVSGENLGERIALAGPADELKELADTFDGMLGRLDAAFASQRHFVANASHELRTPLAIMRTEVDVALADPEPQVDELRCMGEAVRDTVDRCERLIASLLTLARSETAAGRDETVDLAALTGDCITDLRARAHEAHVTVHDDLEPCEIFAEPALLERLVANLLDNGLHHNVPGGFLEVSTRTHGGRGILRVINGGAVIPAEDVAELAEPFRRRNRTVSGFGLGLSIVRSVAETYGGSVKLLARTGGGLDVTVELPAAVGERVPAGPARPEREPARSGHYEAPLTES